MLTALRAPAGILAIARRGLRATALTVALVATLGALHAPGAAAQTPPSPGTLFVNDTIVQPASLPGVVQVASSTGAQTAIPLPNPSNFINPTGVAVAPNGTVYVVDFYCCTNGNGGVIRLDPTTGAQTIVSDDSPPNSPVTGFAQPWALAVASSGTIYVVDQSRGIFRVDPATGQQTILTALLPPLSIPNGIAITSDGTLYVTDADCCAGEGGGIIRIDPTTGMATILTQGGFLGGLIGLTVGPGGALYAVGNTMGPSVQPGVVRVDPSTGAQTPVPLPMPSLVISPSGIAAFGNALFVSDLGCCPNPNNNNPDSGVIQIDATTGAQSILTRDNHLAQPIAIAAVVSVATK
jgi:sugar lactone lactonase YvrE